MSNITTDLLEELISYNNELQCAKDTVALVQGSDTLVISNMENGRTEEELTEPLQHLFMMSSKKPYCDVQYVSQLQKELDIPLKETCRSVNVFDINTFLLAIRPCQSQLIESIDDLCCVYHDYIDLFDKLHILNSFCERTPCQGQIIAGARLTKPKRSSIKFRIAHPPFVYEIDSLLENGNENEYERYLENLRQYLNEPIQNKSCVICLAFDYYCKNSSEVDNFRLFFLHTSPITAAAQDTINMLYETGVQKTSLADQCFLFDEVLSNTQILSISDTENSQERNIVRYKTSDTYKLYF